MKIMIIMMILSTGLMAQEGERRLVDDISGGARILDISGGGHAVPGIEGKIELLKLDRISGTTKYKLNDARPAIKKLSGSMMRPDHIAKMLKIRVMTKLEDISEITLRDGTVIKVEELLK